MSATTTFDPFADLYLAQDRLPPSHHPVNLRTIDPFHRALLAIDGTVTRFIEAYRMEPVDVEVVSQETMPLATAHPWLDVPGGSMVVAREVRLRGRESGALFAHATSLLAIDVLPAHLLQALERNPAGIGGALIDSRLETRREILWYGRTRGGQGSRATDDGAEWLSRVYRVVSGGRPIMVINERFPLLVDEHPRHH